MTTLAIAGVSVNPESVVVLGWIVARETGSLDQERMDRVAKGGGGGGEIDATV